MFPTKFEFIKAFASLPTLILAFVFQHNFFPIYKVLEHSSDKRMVKVTAASTLSALTLYLTVGFFGLATLGNKIKPDYLVGFEIDTIGKPLFVILNVTFVISSTCSFPLMFFSGRNNYLSMI